MTKTCFAMFSEKKYRERVFVKPQLPIYFRPFIGIPCPSICSCFFVARVEEGRKQKIPKLLRLTVHCSSQTANKTQKFAANVCSIPYSKARFVTFVEWFSSWVLVVVVSIIFYVHPYSGEIPVLIMFSKGLKPPTSKSWATWEHERNFWD